MLAKNTSDKGSLSKTCKGLLKLDSKKITQLKNGSKIRQLTKDNIQMANKHKKLYSTSYINREMQIKRITRYYYPPIRMAKIQNTDNIKC